MHIFSRMTGAISSFFIIFVLMFSPILNAIPLMQVPTVHAAEFVTNGAFTTDLSGWTTNGTAIHSSLYVNTVRFTGTFGATMDTAGSITQSLTGLSIGTQYTVSFDVTGPSATFTSYAEVDIAQGGIYTDTSGPSGSANGSTVSYSFTFTATHSDVTVRVRAAAENDYIYVDNVSVTGALFTNTTPSITSSATVNVSEGTTAVTTVTATDPDVAGAGQTLSYAITGGADASAFTIDSTTGVLTFVSAPDFETPTDTNTDNDYEVEVTVSDDYSPSATDTQAITVSVTDVALTMTAAQTGDSDSDGQIDFISVDFNMDLNGASVTASDFTVSGYAVTFASEVSPGVVDITLTESGAIDTGATPQVTIVGNITSTPSTGSEAITSGNITPTDAVGPVVTEVTAVPTPSNNTAPQYTFDSSEAGIFNLAGSCGASSPTTVVAGNNTITLTVSNGVHNTCTINVVDGGGIIQIHLI